MPPNSTGSYSSTRIRELEVSTYRESKLEMSNLLAICQSHAECYTGIWRIKDIVVLTYL